MERYKKTVFIEALNNEDFDERLNQELKGKVNATVQVYGMFKAAIMWDEILIDEELLEEAFEGTCGECPYYEKPADGRKKYFICKRVNRKVTESSMICSAYDQERKEGGSDLPETKGENERVRAEDGRRGGLAQDKPAGSLRQDLRKDAFSSVGEADAFGVFQDPGRRIIHGGARC